MIETMHIGVHRTLHCEPCWIKLLKHNLMSCTITFHVLKPEYSGHARPIPWLLRPWLFGSSGHQQPCYWLCGIKGCLAPTWNALTQWSWEMRKYFLSTFCEIGLGCVPRNSTDDKSTFVQVTASCRQAISHYPGKYWPRSVSLHGVIRPQWVNNQRYLSIDIWWKMPI